MAFKSLQRLQLSRYLLFNRLNAVLARLIPNPSRQAAHDWDRLEKLAALQEVHIAAFANKADSCLASLCSTPRLASLRVEGAMCHMAEVDFLNH